MLRFFLLFSFCFLSFNNIKADNKKIDLCSVALPSFANIVDRSLPTVVNISTSKNITKKGVDLSDLIPQLPKNSPFEFFFRDFFNSGIIDNKVETVTSLGSGFIISEDGYIVTNSHVLEGADVVNVKFNDGISKRATIIGKDIKSDIALLKIESKDKLPYVEMGNSDNAKVGDWVIAVGNPFGLGGTVTAGIISARGRNLIAGSNINFIQTDAAINKGNSGGPMFDSEGKLIGINTAIFSNASGGNIGIGFSIPTNIAVPVIEQLKNKGKVTRGWLGVTVQYVDPNMAEALGLERALGAYITAIVADSPAAKSGLLVDDLIIEIAGKNIENPQILAQIISDSKVGDRLKLKILRYENGKLTPKNILVKIENVADKDAQEQAKKAELSYKEYLGLRLTELDEDFRNDYKIPSDLNGILIVGFTEDSKNNIAGLVEGDVITKINQEPVKSFKHLEKIVEKNKKFGKKYAVFSVKRGDFTVIATIDIE
ncbi:MAG: Do family serine endopeptidase [Rickettsiales bacterium]